MSTFFLDLLVCKYPFCGEYNSTGASNIQLLNIITLFITLKSLAIGAKLTKEIQAQILDQITY